MGSESISDMFQKHLIENANLHYGEFMKDLSRLIVSKKDLCELLLVKWMVHLIVWSNSP